ncbi:MAG TPA: universal stress protein [Nocardioides sp.]|jgi:nucleotide-binding universal stress UspA family protein|nr:universal stress protein [Nocardioides sp.]
MSDRSDVIVVGVDGSAGADAALDFALREADARGCRVEVVTAWLWSSSGDVLGHQHQVEDGRVVVQEVQGEVLEQAFARTGLRPSVTTVVVHDFGGRVLTARADRAAMLVVGSGAQSTSTDRTLGSVSEYCLRHSPVPVVVVPEPERVGRRAALGPPSAIPA